jgi:uncharacterized protein YbjQ (UPF0145 family)
MEQVTQPMQPQPAPQQDVKIFTVPILDNVPIKEYKGFVIVRNVRAINILRDLLTAVRDVVGGRSKSYQVIMDKMQAEIIEEAKEEARKMGANAIMTFRVDFESVGAKRVSLIMVSAKGTAVVI